MSTPSRQGPDLPLDRLAAERCRRRRHPAECASFCSSPTICWASSRVGARMMACGPAAPGFQHLDQRDAERGGLAGARLGLADDVETIERLGMKAA